ncbi:MAG: MBL fold metallo-hydrolase [Gemmataceae bacterium]|nr:MBL fold metallo-hydrolase [Gemmataceae bacterium]MCI0737493.1 MBL fold metallo-hydrolase [Gemmataceae bacterium]
MRRSVLAMGCFVLIGLIAYLRIAGSAQSPPERWSAVAPGVFRTGGFPAGYAIVEGGTALLIDAPNAAKDWHSLGVQKLDWIALTSYHRDSCAVADAFARDRISVFAPKGAHEWLSPDGVKKYWQESLPLRSSRTAYQVLPAGIEGVDYILENGKRFQWRGWDIEVVESPGHARAQVSLLARKGKGGPLLAFVGGAFAVTGKLWAPYTTDWDHWTDAGLGPAAKSLRLLADKNPDILCPAYGPVVSKNARAALFQTAEAVEEVGFLKSFERFTKNRLGNAPQYRFLKKEQAESNGSKPWSQVSEHLYLTGNTYVLVSRDNSCLMFDPWDKRSADQFAKLQAEKKLGPLEVVMFSHAHYDHYDGIYHLPDRDKLEVWALDLVTIPVAQPYLLRAPFLDARPVRFDKMPKDGDTLVWREYRFRFHHLPGQTEYTMGVEAAIDGKRYFFTADNFFHQDMFSGSGGWMGLNRSFPPLYAHSAKKVLEAAPDWVLAEHGGPFEFSAEDFRRRVEWGKAAAKAADALCMSGDHQHDWNPHRIRVEPLLQPAKPGTTVKAKLVVQNVLPKKLDYKMTLDGRGIVPDQSWDIDVAGKATAMREFSIRVPEKLSVGRHAFVIHSRKGAELDASDAFLVIEAHE